MDVDIGRAWRYVPTQPNDSLDMLWGGWSGAELGVAWVVWVVCVGAGYNVKGAWIDHRPLQFETSISRKAVRW